MRQIAIKQLKIREAQRADKKHILKLIESWKPYHWDFKPAKEHFTRFFETNDFPNDKFFVGLMDNQIVSVIGYYHDHANEISWLEWFYTHKDYSHLGIGQRMFDLVISELKAKKTKRLLVNTGLDEFYEPAVSFYHKMGLKKTDDIYEEDEDSIIMSKNF